MKNTEDSKEYKEGFYAAKAILSQVFESAKEMSLTGFITYDHVLETVNSLELKAKDYQQ